MFPERKREAEVHPCNLSHKELGNLPGLNFSVWFLLDVMSSESDDVICIFWCLLLYLEALGDAAMPRALWETEASCPKGFYCQFLFDVLRTQIDGVLLSIIYHLSGCLWITYVYDLSIIYYLLFILSLACHVFNNLIQTESLTFTDLSSHSTED